MSIKIKNLLICLLVVFATFFAAASIFSFTNASADGYQSPLPTGYVVEDYEVMDVATTYGTNNKYTYTTANSSNPVGQRFNMEGYKAVRLKAKFTNASIWQEDFVLFAGNANIYTSIERSGLVYFNMRQNSTKTGLIVLNIVSGTSQVNDAAVQTFAHPSWLDFSVAGKTYNIEVGAPAVYDDNGAFAGTLIYLEVDGVRLAEYFYANKNLPFNNGDFGFSANSSCVEITPYDQLAINATKAVVTFPEETYSYVGTPITPTPSVTLVTTKDGVNYGRVIESKYYNISYSNNDIAGSATATLTFKNKYFGTATGTFKIDAATDASGAVITLSQNVYTKDPGRAPRTPNVISVDLDGVAIPQNCYTVSYENNVDVGTAKVILTFKNGYFGQAVALFKINSVLSENHSLDQNPVILDLANFYGGEDNKIELTNPDSDAKNNPFGKTYDLNGADVVRFKMSTTGNLWNQYFGLHCSDTYYRGQNGYFYYTIPSSSNGQLNKIVLDVAQNNQTPFITLKTDIPDGFDIKNQATFNVELGAVKIYYTEDGIISYAGRQFYLELNGVRVSEYVYLNDSLSFNGGNFYIGGNTSDITIEQSDYYVPSQEPPTQPSNTNDNKMLIPIITSAAAATVIFLVAVVIVKTKKRKTR